MTRVVFWSPQSSSRLLKARHILYAEARMMGVLMSIAAWGEGVKCSLSPPSSDRLSITQKHTQQHWLGQRAHPLCCARPRPPSPRSDEYISNNLDDLMGEPPEFCPTHACNVYSPIGKNWHWKSWIKINSDIVWMIYCQYGSIMCTDTAFISWICIPKDNMSLYTRFFMKYISKC